MVKPYYWVTIFPLCNRPGLRKIVWNKAVRRNFHCATQRAKNSPHQNSKNFACMSTHERNYTHTRSQGTRPATKQDGVGPRKFSNVLLNGRKAWLNPAFPMTSAEPSPISASGHTHISAPFHI